MSTINITGTGGIIEGNLGAANVNVNLDAAYNFVGSDDEHITIADNSALDLGAGDFTLSCWTNAIFTSQGSSYNTLIAKGGAASGGASYALNILADGSVFFKAGDGQFISSGAGKYVNDGSFVHIAGVKNGTTFKIYINGVEVVSQTRTDVDTDNNDALILAGDTGASRHITGKLGDVRIYNTALSASNIQVLASKINVNQELGAGTTNLVGRWPIIGTSIDITDNSSNSNNGTAVNSPTTVYDSFSVDVYDNSTTTDGTFTVTQGKVEGLSLTSLIMDGAADYVTLGSNTVSTNHTVSAWVNVTASSASKIIFDIRDANNDGVLIMSDASENIQYQVNDSDLVSTAVHAGSWIHIIASYDGTTQKLFINGVLDASSATSKTISQSATGYIGVRSHTGRDAYFKGSIRDVRIFDYGLSDDQASSLYSGSYNVTPQYWYKLDEGSGATATIEDYGTATDIDGTGVSLAWTNGTLDLDGALTIAANGTLSAPRGDLDLAGNFTIAADTSTYTHNSGTFKPSANCEFLPADFDSSENARHIFHNVAHTGGTLYIERPCKIEGTYTKTGGELRHYTKVTFGTDAASGNMTINHTTWNMYGYYGNPMLYAANELFPVNIGGSVSDPINWDVIDQRASGGQNTVTHIKGINYGNTGGTPATKNTTTGGGGARIQLDGDCEFDGFTLSSGDTLDLNGQRMETSGAITRQGTISDTGGGGMIFTDSGYNCSPSAGNRLTSTDLIVRGNGTNDIDTFRTLMFNLGTATEDVFNWCHSGDVTTKVIVGSGTVDNDTRNKDQECLDLTIATGGILTMGDETVTVAGDFTTSGGLLGASCLEFNGSDEYVKSAAFADDRNTANDADYTIEFWFKKTTTAISSGSEYLFDLKSTSANNNNRSFARLNTSEQLQWLTYNNSAGEHPNLSGNTTGLNDGKWHHAAFVFYGTSGAFSGTYPKGAKAIYLDGKLDAFVEGGHGGASWSQFTQGTTMALTLGRDESGTDDYFDGCIDEFRVWSDVRTEAEIRTNMFSEVAVDSANLRHQYSFNEGSTDDVEDTATSTTGEAHLEVDLITYDGSGAATDLWAGAGTFTYGTSTLSMTGTSKNMNLFGGDTDIYNLDIQGTITNVNYGANNNFKVQNNLTVGTNKTLTSSGQIKLYNSGATFTFATPATNVVNVTSFSTRESGTFTIPEVTMNKMFLDTSGSNVVASGNHTYNQELEVNGGTTFNANGNTINVKNTDVNGGTLDLRNSTLNFYTGASDTWTMSSSSTLTTGNTTVTGDSTKTPTNIPESAGGGFEIVGNVSNLDVTGDLTVIGSVTNCTGNIRQWHHTLDTQQLLDADEAGDDDLRLTKPALDNALELMTK
jgi:hypothetical protein